MWGAENRSSHSASQELPPCCTLTTWHLYKALRLQSPGHTMAPFRLRGACSRPEPWPWSDRLAWARPWLQHWTCQPSSMREGRRCWVLGCMCAPEPTYQLLGEQPAPFLFTSILLALSGVAVAVSTASPGGAWCWSISMALSAVWRGWLPLCGSPHAPQL